MFALLTLSVLFVSFALLLNTLCWKFIFRFELPLDHHKPLKKIFPGLIHRFSLGDGIFSFSVIFMYLLHPSCHSCIVQIVDLIVSSILCNLLLWNSWVLLKCYWAHSHMPSIQSCAVVNCNTPYFLLLSKWSSIQCHLETLLATLNLEYNLLLIFSFF